MKITRLYLFTTLSVFSCTSGSSETIENPADSEVVDTASYIKPETPLKGSSSTPVSIITALDRVLPKDGRHRKVTEVDYRLYWALLSGSRDYNYEDGSVNDSSINAQLAYYSRVDNLKVYISSHSEFADKLDVPGVRFTQEELQVVLTGSDTGYAKYRQGKFHKFKGTLYEDRKDN